MNDLKNAQIIISRMGSSFEGFCSELRNAELNPIFKEIGRDAANLIRQQDPVYNTPIVTGSRIYFAEIPTPPEKIMRHWLIKV